MSSQKFPSVVGTALFFILIFKTLDPYPLSGLIVNLYGVAAVAGLLLCAWAQGRFFVEKISITNAMERGVFGIAIGLIAISMEVFLLGVLGLWSAPLMKFYGVIIAVVALMSLRIISLPVLIQKDPAWILAFPFGFSLITALAPPTHYDSMVYHLGLPTLYLQAGRWFPMPEHLFSFFPQLMEMLFTLLLGMGSINGPSVLVWAIGVLSAVAIYSFAARYFSRSVGFFACLILAFTPFFHILIADAFVDVPLMFYSFLAIYAYFLSDEETDCGRLACLAGLMAGGAFGVKYTGGLAVVFVGAALWRRGKLLLVFTAASLLTAAPWLIRNAFISGNPVYPFLYPLIGHSVWAEALTLRFIEHTLESGSIRTHLVRLPYSLWGLITDSPKLDSRLDIAGNFGWAFPFALLSLRIFGGSKTKLVMYLIAYVLTWVISKPVSRFLVPAFPILVLLASDAYATWLSKAPRAARITLYAGLSVFVIFNIYTYAMIERASGKFVAGLGLISKEEYLTDHLNYYAAASFINRHTPPNSRIYVLWDQRPHYFERELDMRTVFAVEPLLAALENSADTDEFRSFMSSRGVSHIFVNDAERIRLASYKTYDLSDTANARWEDYVRNSTVPIYKDPFCRVLEIR